MIYDIEPENSFKVAGRGQIFTANRLDQPDVVKVKIGDHIRTKGQLWLVRGIETFVKPMDRPIPGDNVGFVVRLVEEEDDNQQAL